MYNLIIEDDEGKTRVVRLVRDEVTIGRKEGNNIRLTERNVSRKHARLVRQSNALFIEDLTSYNGVKVNGDRISGRAPLNEGDRVQIGDYQIAIKADKGESAGAPTSESSEAETTPFLREPGTNGMPTAQMELTPTVQQAILASGLGPPPPRASSDPRARLVAVSANFARQEFPLDKSTMVIGRTHENDIVINHRSISRHHAKIAREGNAFHIIDLQSANGVRVNGEEYGKVELRRGDLIDLGHVKVRFVEPNEDFVFDRDAEIVNVGGGRSRVALVVGLVMAIAVIAGGAVVYLKMGPGHTTTVATTTSGDSNTTKPVVTEPVVVKPAVPTADTEAQVAKLMMDADHAIKAEDWDQALAKANAALALDSQQDLARDRKSKAEAEMKNRTAYANFVAAAGKSDYDSALASFGEISADSIYRPKGTDQFGKVKQAYIRTHLDAAKRAKTANKCDEARQHVEAILAVDDAQSEAKDVLRTCGAHATVAIAPTPHTPKVVPTPHVKEVKEPPKETPPAPVDDDANAVAAEKILRDARDAYVHAQYETAISLSRKSLKLKTSFEAWKYIGASACFLKDKPGAMVAYAKLDGTGRTFLKYICTRNAISVP